MNKSGSLMFLKLSPLQNGFRLVLAKTATRWSSVYMQYCVTGKNIFYIVEDTQITFSKALLQLTFLAMMLFHFFAF